MVVSKVILCLSLFISFVFASRDLKGAVDGLVTQLQTQSNATDQGGVVMVPTVSVDLWTLLRLAAQNELKEQKEKLRLSRQESLAAGKPFPAALLDLVNLGGKNYFVSKRQKLPWVEAIAFCRIYGMDLASIETREEDQLISDHLNALGLGGTSGNVVHLSGNKIGRSAFIWLNGAHLIYENWGPEEPNNIAIHHCLCHHKTQWYDYPCGNESFFICEEP